MSLTTLIYYKRIYKNNKDNIVYNINYVSKDVINGN